MSSKTILTAFLLVPLLAAQDRNKPGRIDVENYAIDAEINPRTQALSATAKIRLTALDNDVSTALFELNNALTISRVVDDSGRQIPASRASDLGVRVSFPAPLTKGKETTLTFVYDGRLSGQEDSPVYGIKFASIQNTFAYLLYPARWFPIHDYTVDRYSANMNITVPTGFQVVASGIQSTQPAADGKVTYSFQFDKPSFPGSIAMVQGDPVRVNSEGVTTTVYFRQKQSMANDYGDETGKIMSFPDQLVRPAADSQPDASGNRGRHAERLLGARDHLPFTSRHWQPGGRAAFGEPSVAAVVGNAGIAHQPGSYVAGERQRPLRGAVVG